MSKQLFINIGNAAGPGELFSTAVAASATPKLRAFDVDRLGIVTSGETSPIGTNFTMTVAALPAALNAGDVLTFTDGGKFTLDAAAAKGATEIVGDTTVAEITSGETANIGVSLPLSLTNSADRIQFVQNPKTGEAPLLSPIIEKAKVKSVIKRAYLAPVAQISRIAPQATFTGEITIRVIKTSTGYRPDQVGKITLENGSKYANVAAICDAIVEKFNALKGINNFVTATDNATSVDLTSDDASVSFVTKIEGTASDNFLVTSQASPNFGSGSATQVVAFEKVSQGLNANFMNQVYLPLDVPSYVDLTKTYDIYTVMVETNTTENISKANKYLEVIIAAEAGATGIDLNTFFGV